jgi:hypothetical protein
MPDIIADIRLYGRHDLVANNVHLASVPRVGERIEYMKSPAAANYTIVEVIHAIEYVKPRDGSQHRIVLVVTDYSEADKNAVQARIT